MTKWTELPLAVYDSETTGTDTSSDRIVTAYLGRITDGAVTGRTWIANPGIPIPAAATEIHGYNDEYVRKHGRPHSDVVAEIVAGLYDIWAEGRVLATYNGSFDLSLLATWHPGFEIRGPVFDGFVIDKQYDRYRKGSRKLSAVCIHYGVRLDDAHDAESDAVGAGRLAWKLPRVYPHLATLTASELMTAQAQWSEEQAYSLIDYLRRNDRPFDDVRTEWPIHTKKAQAA